MIAQCMLQLGRKDEAKGWLLKAVKIAVKTQDDKEAIAEARALLYKHFGITDP